MSKRQMGVFKIAMRHPVTGKTFLQDESASIVGPLAVHRYNSGPYRWRISHAATGMAVPYAYGRTSKEAHQVAEALADAVDWSSLTPGQRIGQYSGLSDDMKRTALRIMASFPFLEVPSSSVQG